VDAFVGTIGDQVRSGTKVTIYGFGSFNPTSRKARTGRNPRTGQPVKIAASKGIRFSPATGFKADLNMKKAAARKMAAAKTAAAKAPAARATTAKTAAAKAPAAKANGRVVARATSARAAKATKTAQAAPAKANGRKTAAAAKATAPRPVGRPKKAAVTVAKAPA
jgi:DNA-binding protein HU-beta